MKTKLLLLAAAFPFFLFSCSKDDKQNEDCPADMSHIAGNYRLAALTYKSSPTATPENFLDEFFDLCTRDDIITLNANGTGITTDAGIKCDDTDEIYNFNWSLSGSNITIDDEDWSIKSYDCKTLQLRYDDYYDDNDQLLLTLTRQ